MYYVHTRSNFSSFELEPKLAHLHDFVEEAIQCLSLEGKSVTLLLHSCYVVHRLYYIEYVLNYKAAEAEKWRCVGGGDGAHRKDFLNFVSKEDKVKSYVIVSTESELTLYYMGVGVRTDPPLALSAAILWGMHQPIPNFLTFPNLIPTFIW